MLSFETLPSDATSLTETPWSEFGPLFDALLAEELTAASVPDFLKRWSHLTELIGEIEQRLYVAKTVNTADEASDRAFTRYLEDIYPPYQTAEQALKEKLLDSGLEPEGFDVQLRAMRAEAEQFRSENVPLLAEEQKLGSEYQEISGSQTVEWRGQDLPLARVRPFLEDPDRDVREQAWTLMARRRLQDKAKLDDLWRRSFALRQEIAANAGYPSFREYRWHQLHRFDYTPEENHAFHEAVLEVVTPAVNRIVEKRRQRLGLTTLRPWDLSVDIRGEAPLRPFTEAEELVAGVGRMIHALDPQLGSYFDAMDSGGLLDLDSRKNKAPGGYCTSYSAIKRPFIFMNAAGIHQDVVTLLHESGHAFHVFETSGLPYVQQRHPGHEFAEVASMSMELFAAPYLPSDKGGFYSRAEAARARLDHLEGILQLLPRIMYVDAFQHWAYTHAEAATDPDACAQAWLDVYTKFVPYVDYSGLEEEVAAGWQAILHIFEVPFYIIEYGMAQTAALNLWVQSQSAPATALARYRTALALGSTKPLPELFAAVGAPFAFTAEVLRPLVDAMMSAIDELEAEASA